MDQKLATLTAEVILDQSPLRKSLAGLRGKLAPTISTIGRNLGSQFSRAFSIAAKAGIAAGIAGGIFAIKAAGDAAEIQSKFEAVFKDLTDDAEQFAGDFAKAIGRSVIDTKQQLASFQDTFVPLGFARDRAAELSKQLVGLTADLASFNNQSDSEASEKLIGTLIGNHENARSWGVIITEATLNQKLLEQGIKGGTKAATEQQKVLARLAMITEGTTDAQGDAARTAGSFANQLKALRGQIKDTAVNVGQALLPAATEIVHSLRNWAASLDQHKQKLAEWGRVIGRAVSVQLKKFQAWIRDNKEMLLGAIKAVPKFLALAAAVKALSVAFAGMSAASSLATLLSPAGLLIVGLGALAAAFAHSRIEGQSWGDSIAELTAKTIGFKNAVTELKKAQEELNKTHDRDAEFRAIRKQIDEERKAGTLTKERLQEHLAAMKKIRDEQQQHADEQSKKARATMKVAEKNYQDAIKPSWSKLSPLGFAAASWDLIKARGELHDVKGKQTVADQGYDQVRAFDREMQRIRNQGTNVAPAAEPSPANRNPFSPAESSGGGWRGLAKNIGKGIADQAKELSYRAGIKARGALGAVTSGGKKALGAVTDVMAYEQQLRQGKTQASDRTTMFAGLSEYSRQLQTSIGGSSPELKTAKATEKNTNETVTVLGKIFNHMVDAERNNRKSVATVV